jgi:hypothetical protein
MDSQWVCAARSVALTIARKRMLTGFRRWAPTMSISLREAAFCGDLLPEGCSLEVMGS